ncbi:MAG: diguanylate cyclase, partial [Gammaproteobacteria bacterium]|nr:diguanylate cyclase [Gammaproteobacteria bacterium]
MKKNNQPKILIVDDKNENLIVLEKLLSSLEVEIIKAHSGNEALTLMIEHEFVLVLLDVQMPNMNGYEVLEVMSWDEKTRYIPVIFITANYADEQHKIKGYQYGAVDYLYKPINDVVLLSKVKIFLDLHQQKIKYKQLNQRYQLIINSAGEGIFGVDLEKNISFINPAAEKILGYPANYLTSKPIGIIIEEHRLSYEIDDKNMFYIDDILSTCHEGRSFHKDEAHFKKNDSDLLPVEFTASPIFLDDNEFNGVVFVFSDITLRKTVEEQLTNLALYDHLTKLPNRLFFEKTINQAISRSKRNKTLMALLFLDLDHFKDINDRLGHDVGDLLLKGVSNRLRDCIRASDTVSRLGGDEFAIILDEIAANDDAGLIAKKIIESLSSPFSLNGNEVFISTSIGIATYPESGDTPVTLIKNADIAMYEAKQAGRDRYCFFTDLMNEQIRFRLEMVHGLHYAIDRDELQLYYQPKLDLKTNNISGMEALIRWHHPTLGILKPADFIPIAEETGLIRKIGKWTIDEACRMNKHWQDAGLMSCCVAVNLSYFQLVQDNIIDIIQDALQESGLSAKYLEVELTETSLVANPEKLSDVLIQ